MRIKGKFNGLSYEITKDGTYANKSKEDLYNTYFSGVYCPQCSDIEKLEIMRTDYDTFNRKYHCGNCGCYFNVTAKGLKVKKSTNEMTESEFEKDVLHKFSIAAISYLVCYFASLFWYIHNCKVSTESDTWVLLHTTGGIIFGILSIVGLLFMLLCFVCSIIEDTKYE
jgi:transcription elongation factor Elf1